MKRRRKTWIVVAAVGVTSLGRLDGAFAQSSSGGLSAFSDDLERVAAQVRPAIVQIVASGYVAAQGSGAGLLSRQRGTGSGVIVDAAGYVITNAHVIAGAQRLQVVVRVPPVDLLDGQGDPGLGGVLRNGGLRVRVLRFLGEDEPRGDRQRQQ